MKNADEDQTIADGINVRTATITLIYPVDGQTSKQIPYGVICDIITPNLYGLLYRERINVSEYPERELKAIREKYTDRDGMLHQEMWKLWRNPLEQSEVFFDLTKIFQNGISISSAKVVSVKPPEKISAIVYDKNYKCTSDTIQQWATDQLRLFASTSFWSFIQPNANVEYDYACFDDIRVRDHRNSLKSLSDKIEFLV